MPYCTIPPHADIMKTCYDVRLGAEHCRVPFPRLVPSGCCFSFSVLKRTYYVFSPTAAEAKRWVECMTSVSAILNRRQSAFESSLSSIPLPTRGYGGSGPPSSEHKKKSNRRLMRRPGAIDKGPKPAGPEASASKHHTVTGPVEYQRTREPEDKLSESLVFTQKPVHHKHTAGSTQTRHDNSEAKSPVQYKRSVPDSKLWLDGSPSPRVVPESALSQPTSSPSEIQKSPKYRDHSAMFSSCDHSLHLRGSASASPLHHGATLPRPQIKRKASYQPLPTAALAMHFQRLQHREAVIRRGLAMMEPPRRPGSVDFTTSLPHSYYLPSRPQLPAQAHSRHHHYCNTSEMLARSGRRRSGDRIPPIVKPKPILKSPKGSLTPTQQMEFAAATHATSECSSTSGSSVDLAYHRYHHLRSRSSPGPVASIRESSPDSPTSEPQLGLMPPPPLTGPPPSRPPPPPPPNSPPPPNALEFLEPSPVSLATPQADQPSKQTAAARDRSISERKSPLTREWETNNWALHELRKVS